MRVVAFAALVMLVVQFGLGMGVNLFAQLPASDYGGGVLAAFVGAVIDGPATLTLHALLGTLLLGSAIAVLVRAILVRKTAFVTLAAVGLLAILLAWGAGSWFVGTADSGSSMAMALATGVAILSYATILLITPRSEKA